MDISAWWSGSRKKGGSYKCDHPGCDRSFGLKHNLQRHQRINHGRMPSRKVQTRSPTRNLNVIQGILAAAAEQQRKVADLNFVDTRGEYHQVNKDNIFTQSSGYDSFREAIEIAPFEYVKDELNIRRDELDNDIGQLERTSSPIDFEDTTRSPSTVEAEIDK